MRRLRETYKVRSHLLLARPSFFSEGHASSFSPNVVPNSKEKIATNAAKITPPFILYRSDCFLVRVLDSVLHCTPTELVDMAKIIKLPACTPFYILLRKISSRRKY